MELQAVKEDRVVVPGDSSRVFSLIEAVQGSAGSQPWGAGAPEATRWASSRRILSSTSERTFTLAT